MKLAPDQPTDTEDVATRRKHGRSEPFLALGRAVMRQRLPPWPSAFVLASGLLTYAASELLAPVVSAAEVYIQSAGSVVVEPDDLDRVRRANDEALRAALDRQAELETRVANLEARTEAMLEDCPRDVSDLLRWLVSTNAIDGNALTPDLKLCLLLPERQQREDSTK
jgi:hypothetical protein